MKHLFFGAVVVVLVFSFCGAFGGPSCPQIVQELTPCVTFMQGKDPSPLCCEGLKHLSDTVKTKDDRVQACNCAKDALSHFKYDPNRIPLLPKLCGINISLPPITPDTDCNNW
ncbi:hypothetical protein LguiB_023766 [Lonicera macranthoides]